MSNYALPVVLFTILMFAGAAHAMLDVGGDNNEDTEPQLKLELNSTCDGLIVAVTADDQPVEGAYATVRRVSDAILLAWGNTDVDGQIVFDICGDRVDVKATKTGYQKSDIETIQLIPCEECAGCTSNADCPTNSVCSAGSCIPIDCCGVIENHTCTPYECCSNQGCPAGQSCSNNTCVPQIPPVDIGCTEDDDCLQTEHCVDGECVPVPCGCGSIENHSCSLYECCTAEDCAADQLCINNTCTSLQEPIEEEQPFQVFGAAAQSLVILLLLVVVAYWALRKK